jgi:sec-independent protein translocase protein TatB
MPGSGELLVIFVLVLLLFGPDKLPELARQFGKGMREIRKASDEFRRQLKIDDD